MRSLAVGFMASVGVVIGGGLGTAAFVVGAFYLLILILADIG